MLGLELLHLQLYLGQDQAFFLQVSSSYLLATEGIPYQNLQGQLQTGFLHVAFGPLSHVGFPFVMGFQRKLLFWRQLIPLCLWKFKIDFV